MARTASPLPPALAKASQRFESWRADRTTRRIPEELWSLATELGTRFGVSRTARALGVQYYGLKKRIEAIREEDPGMSEEPPTFVEILTTPPTAHPAGCIIEIERASGDRVRIELNGAKTTDVAELARQFLDPRS